MYASFKPLFAKYWGASPSTLYRVDHYSLTCYSAYLDFGPWQMRLVPVECLEFVQ